jgi:OOP family OmpA-OmpF porin
MSIRTHLGFLTALSLAAVAGCSSAPYAPVTFQVDPVDISAFAPKVDAFVVLLDTSGSMDDEFEQRSKIHSAQDLVASFNRAVPPLPFNAGMATFGKGINSCTGYGVANNIYGFTKYRTAELAQALGSIKCAASTTPIVDAVDIATEMLVEETGPTAVFIVSDFQWSDPSAVLEAVGKLKAQHGDNVCLHTVQVGDNVRTDSLIADLTATAGCDSAVNATDITSASAMSAYVVSTLMAPLEYETHTVSATTLFDFDKSILKQQGKAELMNLGERIKSAGMSVGDIDVVGHTDSRGSRGYNQSLSERRAMAVKAYLGDNGIDSGIIDATGMGENQPVASNSSDAGRAQNRRVEIHVGTSRPLR